MSTLSQALQFTSLLPSIFQFVEDIHGPKTGAVKLGSAVTLAQSAALVLARAGMVPEADAHDLLDITNIVQDTFNSVRGMIQSVKQPAQLEGQGVDVASLGKPILVAAPRVKPTGVLLPASPAAPIAHKPALVMQQNISDIVRQTLK